MKKIILAETAGFCMGVALALRKLDQAIAAKDPVQTIFTQGPIIHNPQVLQYYQAQGVFQCNTHDQLDPSTIVVVRAHGIPRAVQQDIEAHGAPIVDATCPKVKKAQMLIARNAERGRHLLLFGEKDHPEVKGLVSHATAGFSVFESIEEIGDLLSHLEGPFFLAAQTTQDKEEFEAIKDSLLKKIPDLPIMDTICTATKERQQEALRIAQEVDFMVVVGGKNSGNTRRLAQVAGSQETPCCHIERVEELPFEQLIGCKTIGLTAGASTPEDVIHEVYQTLMEL